MQTLPPTFVRWVFEPSTEPTPAAAAEDRLRRVRQAGIEPIRSHKQHLPDGRVVLTVQLATKEDGEVLTVMFDGFFRLPNSLDEPLPE